MDIIKHADLTALACDAELVGSSVAPRNERHSDAAAPPAPVRGDEDDATAGSAAAEMSHTTNNNLDDALDTAMDVTEMMSNVIASNVLPTTIDSYISSDAFN